MRVRLCVRLCVCVCVCVGTCARASHAYAGVPVVQFATTDMDVLLGISSQIKDLEGMTAVLRRIDPTRYATRTHTGALRRGAC